MMQLLVFQNEAVEGDVDRFGKYCIYLKKKVFFKFGNNLIENVTEFWKWDEIINN